MSKESVKEFYDRQYAAFSNSRWACPNALHDLSKAKRRVAGVMKGFQIGSISGAKILDVGSGLGCYTKALSDYGADVVGIDFSESAVKLAERAYPECRFECKSWPNDIRPQRDFDLIWMVNFSLMNTFDVSFIKSALVCEALARLREEGVLVIGWNSNFSGRTIDGYSHWSAEMVGEMRAQCGLSGPLVCEARTQRLSALAISCAKVLQRSIPFFMVIESRASSE